MSGKRVLDAVAVFNAARAVAYQHFTIRQSQLELYTRTSSITRAINRAGQARKDAYNAAHSFSKSTNTAANAQPSSGPETPNLQTVEGERQPIKRTEGLEQDHHYDISQGNSVADSVPEQDLEIQQDKAERYPLADGTTTLTRSGPGRAATGAQGLSSEHVMKLQRQSEAQIPSKPAEPPTIQTSSTTFPPVGESSEFSVEQEQDVFYQPPDSTAPVLSALPRFKIPKTEEDVQGGDPHVPQKINADVFYSSRRLSQNDIANQTDAAQEHPSEEMMGGLFHSPRVARLLGINSKNMPGGIGPKGSRTYVTSQTKFAEGKADTSKANSDDFGTEKGSESNVESLKRLTTNLSMDAQRHQCVGTAHRNPSFAIRADQLTVRQQPSEDTAALSAKRPYEMRESRVPSSQLGRLWEFGGLAASMAFGAAGERFNRPSSNSGEQNSFMLSAGNMDRLVAKLSKMRGAALKLGQMMSFQG
jgi:aarF domain-containing kinase